MSNTTGPENLRRAQRVDMQIEVNFGSEHNFYTGLSENLSEGGIFVVTPNVLPRGTRMTVEFTLPDQGEPIKAQGVVRWTRELENADPDYPSGMGIQFEAIEGGNEARVLEFFRSREPMFYDE